MLLKMFWSWPRRKIMATITAIAVIYGKDADGTKGFISTRADQRSLLAFAVNAMLGAGLFGAMPGTRGQGPSRPPTGPRPSTGDSFPPKPSPPGASARPATAPNCDLS